MSFMQPQIIKTEFWLVDTSDGTECVLCELAGLHDLEQYASGKIDDLVEDVTRQTGYLWRLSAPGYMDCTDWSPADSLFGAISDCLGMFGDGLDIDDYRELLSYIDNSDSLIDSYLVSLGCTARIEKEDGSCEPAFPCQGQFEDHYDSDDIWNVLPDDSRVALLADCLGFLIDAGDLLKPEDYDQAGQDFHLTRNGHGGGFWDCHKWPEDIGRKLTELSKPYGTFELYRYSNEYQTHN